MNFGLAGYLRPPTPHLIAYAASLYAKRRSGLVVPRRPIEIDGWRPEPNECHTNVATVVALDPKVKAVRGWLFFDFELAYAYVRFTAHSVIELSDGEYIDITPPPATRPNAGVYPFLRAGLDELEFQNVSDALITAHRAAHLDHVYR